MRNEARISLLVPMVVCVGLNTAVSVSLAIILRDSNAGAASGIVLLAGCGIIVGVAALSAHRVRARHMNPLDPAVVLRGLCIAAFLLATGAIAVVTGLGAASRNYGPPLGILLACSGVVLESFGMLAGVSGCVRTLRRLFLGRWDDARSHCTGSRSGSDGRPTNR